MSARKKFFPHLMGGIYIFAGVMHFVVPNIYAQIMPDYLPWHLELVYLSGLAEIGLGVGLMIPKLRRLAAWGLIALLVAVFPANINMAVKGITHIEGLPSWMPPPSPIGLWIRLPLQALFIYWAWVFTKPEETAQTTA